jgi:4-alpha-glucanotransferase
VWLHRKIFDLEYSAGAPPDMFSVDGQNWGFPVYNWDALAKQHYRWWKERLKWASRYYHIYRIDHIVGFFRIWTIPRNLDGKSGKFVPEDENLWIDHGQRLIMMMLESNEMLPIGEDLGVVPTTVRECLTTLGICGTKVMRWERKWEEDKRYIPAQEYPIISMTTVSTHDSETLQQWWQMNPQEAQDYAIFKGWHYQPVLSREYHQAILWESHHTASLFHVNPLQEYLALIPGLTQPHLEDERINVPGIVSKKNWTYRFKPSLEELTSNSTLKHCIQEIIK